MTGMGLHVDGHAKDDEDGGFGRSAGRVIALGADLGHCERKRLKGVLQGGAGLAEEGIVGLQFEGMTVSGMRKRGAGSCCIVDMYQISDRPHGEIIPSCFSRITPDVSAGG